MPSSTFLNAPHAHAYYFHLFTIIVVIIKITPVPFLFTNGSIGFIQKKHMSKIQFPMFNLYLPSHPSLIPETFQDSLFSQLSNGRSIAERSKVDDVSLCKEDRKRDNSIIPQCKYVQGNEKSQEFGRVVPIGINSLEY